LFLVEEVSSEHDGAARGCVGGGGGLRVMGEEGVGGGRGGREERKRVRK
jgi:hypothetical protein